MENTQTIVVAEDSPADLHILSTALTKLGYHVIACRNGAEAWNVITAERENIRAAFIDLIMPVMDGFELIKNIRNDVVLRNLPIVVTTSHTEQDFILRTIRLKVNGFMVKPVEMKKLEFHLSNLKDECMEGTELARDEVIFDVGDPSDCLFRVDEGYVGIFKTNDGGEDTLIGYVSPGEYMGEMSLLSEAPHSSKAVALTDVVISGHTRDEIERMLECTPMSITCLLTDLISRLGKTNEVIRQNSLQGALNKKMAEVVDEYNSFQAKKEQELEEKPL